MTKAKSPTILHDPNVCNQCGKVLTTSEYHKSNGTACHKHFNEQGTSENVDEKARRDY